MRLEVLPAKKGDCLLLHYGTEDRPKLMLIDGGPTGVYPETLKPRLTAIREKRIAANLLEEGGKLFIDLVLISHVDDDHINGIKALLTDMANTADPAPFRIGRLWHNSFEKLVDVREGQVAATAAVQVTAGLDAEIDLDGEDDDARLAVAKVIASIKQGHDVLALARKLNIPINPDFGGKAIEATDGSVHDAKGLNVRVLGPLRTELDALRADFAKWLEKREREPGTTASFLASFDDKSVANLSSIVLLVESDDEAYLLTGDARGDKIIEAARQFGLLDANDQLAVDIFKVPHHGSDRNNDVSSFVAFPASRYIFSGNGEHGNPERETFEYLAEARPGVQLVVELPYSPSHIDRERKVEWDKKQTKKAHPKPFDLPTQGIEPFLNGQGDFTVEFPPE